MTSPLYSVGRHVAVCSFDCSVIIPQTTVTGCRQFDADPHTLHPLTGLPSATPRGGWAYTVADGPESIVGTAVWFMESSLRPIQPGEYLSDSARQKPETTL